MKISGNLSIALFVLIALATPSRADTITLMSGNGTVGSNDSAITFFDPGGGACCFAWTGTIPSADFTSALTGSAAYIISPSPDPWLQSTGGQLPTNAAAQWIGVSATSNSASGPGPDDGGLYAISFYIPTAVTSATLDFDFAADNLLGGGAYGVNGTPGLYINGQGVPGDTIGGGYTAESFFDNIDINSLLVVGTNTLYVAESNLGGPAGLIFSASVDYTPSADTSVPAPGALALLGLGLAGFGAMRRRKAG